MNLQTDIFKVINNDTIKKIAEQSGADQITTQSVIEQSLPLLLGKLGQNSQTESGAQALGVALAKDHDGSLLDNIIGMLGQSSTQSDGQKILGHIFGSNSSANKVAGKVGSKNGLDAATVMSILALLAPIVMGYLGKTKQQKGLDSKDLANELNNQKLNDSGGLLSALSGMLDHDGDGSPIDGIIDIGKSILNKK